jgi:hypothetical protein
MKNFKLMAIALVAMLGFTACEKDCNHDFIEHDFTKDIVGTWTYVNGGQAEAMVIKADGSFTTTGVMIHGALYEEKGTIKVVNNKVTLAYDSGDVFEGRLELVAGKSMSIVLFEEDNIRLDYDYCKEDLSDEIIGMWIYNDEKEMRIHSFEENGRAVFTGWSEDLGVLSVLQDSDYKVIGDLIFQGFSSDEDSFAKYIAARIIYTPNGTAHGDIMTFKHYLFDGTESAQSWLRVKQNLNLAGKTYDYISAYVTNVKGKDEDFNISGNTFNIAKMDAGDFDVMFRSLLSCYEFPDANTFKHTFSVNGQDAELVVPITVEGNKVTMEMTTVAPVLRNVEMYMFQDADDSQMHCYMPTTSFINYFGNLEFTTLLTEGKIAPADTAAIDKVFADMKARVQSINVSFVFKARK